jgi:hypothetical protein
VNAVISSTPAKSIGLQAVDYYLWALQRFYQRREARFLELIWPQVGEIHDLDRVEYGKRGIFYTKEKPLNLADFDELGGRGYRVYGSRPANHTAWSRILSPTTARGYPPALLLSSSMVQKPDRQGRGRT